MPRNSFVDITAGSWVELTANDVTNITFVNIDVNDVVWIKATVGSVSPGDETNLSGSIPYEGGFGESNIALSSLFPGVSGANRLWAFCRQSATMQVSHA